MDRTLFIMVLAAGMLTGQGVGAGNISGVVSAQGKQEADAEAGGGNYSSKALKTAERINYDEMQDFVVYIKGPVPGAKPVRPLEQIHQKNATFVPHVLPVMVGTAVEFPNDDNIFHNVFSKSDAAPFDLGLYKKGDPPHQVTCTNVGEVDVFCSIHARMSCVILVLENPYFAVADSRGRYTISNVPPGTYTVCAWQERLPKDSKVITVPAEGDRPGINFVLGPKNLPRY
jgi:polysaccharide lyase family 4-like protein